MPSQNIPTLLRKNGFRVTKAKEELLELLEDVGTPLSVQEIMSSWPHHPNQATVYRILSDLCKTNIVKCVSTHNGTTLFEYSPNKPHHHHAICTDCGSIEDIPLCLGQIEQKAFSYLKKFSNVATHELTFYGTCIKCNYRTV